VHYYRFDKALQEVEVYRVPFEFFFKDEFNSPDLEKKYPLKKKSKYHPIEISEDDLKKLDHD
jgi:hypothetical protein